MARLKSSSAILAGLVLAVFSGPTAADVPRLADTAAERQFVANRDPGRWGPLLEAYAATYAKARKGPRRERTASLYRALDLLALYASASGKDVGAVSSLGGRAVAPVRYVVAYDKFFHDNFSRYRFGAASRRAWVGKTVVVAVSKETCDLKSFRFARKGQITGRLADYTGGFYDPFKPNAFFKVALGDSQALDDADLAYAMESCEKDSKFTSAFPRFVVHGQVICDDTACKDNPQFLISHVAYAWSSGNVVRFLGDTVHTAETLKSVLQPLGLR